MSAREPPRIQLGEEAEGCPCQVLLQPRTTASSAPLEGTFSQARASPSLGGRGKAVLFPHREALPGNQGHRNQACRARLRKEDTASLCLRASARLACALAGHGAGTADNPYRRAPSPSPRAAVVEGSSPPDHGRSLE